MPGPFDWRARQEQRHRRRPGTGELARQGLGLSDRVSAPAYLYRKSWFQELGITQPPATTDDEFEYAAKLTQKQGTTPTRFGGQMFSFDGDHPTAIDVASPQAIDAVGWWKKLVQQGYTDVNVMSYPQSWQQSK